MGIFERVCNMITEQQKGKEGTAAWMVGEQLKEIAEREPISAELLEKDLAIPEMSLADAEKQIHKKADELREKQKGNCACVPPNVAEEVLRQFYGLPEKGKTTQAEKNAPLLNLADFI